MDAAIEGRRRLEDLTDVNLIVGIVGRIKHPESRPYAIASGKLDRGLEVAIAQGDRIIGSDHATRIRATTHRGIATTCIATFEHKLGARLKYVGWQIRLQLTVIRGGIAPFVFSGPQQHVG